MEETLTEVLHTHNTVPALRKWLLQIMDWLNIGASENSTLYILISLGLALLSVALIEVLLRVLFIGAATKLLQRVPSLSNNSHATLKKVVGKVIRIIAVSILIGLLSIVFLDVASIGYKASRIVLGVYCIALIAQLAGQLLDLARTSMLNSEKYRNSPFVNLFQVIKGIVWFLAVLYMVSIIFSINMTTITASLAALSAVLMLVFKDSILGFVASIQLSSNDMVRVGDWISMPKYGADGDVIDISLATIKVMNFDKTVTTIPPYSLIADSFQNWRFMKEAGGRRVKRAIYIDMQTIRYADEAFLERIKSVPILKDYIETATHEIEIDNSSRGLTDSFTRRRLTNVGIFRRYVQAYLQNHPHVHKEYTLLVRQQQPTEAGLPLELYFFTDTTVWAEYEGIQSDVFDHVLAVINHFDLRVFQAVNSNDMRLLVEAESVKNSSAVLPSKE